MGEKTGRAVLKIAGKFGTRYLVEDGMLYRVETVESKKGRKKIEAEKRTRYLQVGDDTDRALRYVAEIEKMPLWKVRRNTERVA